jgi:hypothetical protein
MQAHDWSLPLPADDADPDFLIARLSCPLEPDDAADFRAAALAALAGISCWGEGVCWRTVSVLQRAYRIPPPDVRTSWDISQERPGSSKLANGPPIGRGRNLHVNGRLVG